MKVLDILDPFYVEPPARDLDFAFFGSIVLCTPLTDEGQRWIDEHIDPEAQWYGASLIVEPRYIDNLLAGALAGGLVCRADH
jgi:hypothetical protein